MNKVGQITSPLGSSQKEIVCNIETGMQMYLDYGCGLEASYASISLHHTNKLQSLHSLKASSKCQATLAWLEVSTS